MRHRSHMPRCRRLFLAALFALAAPFAQATEPTTAQPPSEISRNNGLSAQVNLSEMPPAWWTMSDDEREFLRAEIARHNHGSLGATREEALIKALELCFAEPNPGNESLRNRMVQYLRTLPPSEFSTEPWQTPQFPSRATRSTRDVRPISRGTLYAGAASSNITFPLGSPMAGHIRFPPQLDNPTVDPYGHSTLYASAEGTRDKLRAKVICLETRRPGAANQTYFLVGLDAVASSTELIDGIVEYVRANHPGLPVTADNIIISGTHTHHGGGGVTQVPFWNVATADIFDQRLYDIMMKQLGTALQAAYTQRQPARLGYSQTSAHTPDIQRNRRDDPPMVDRDMGVIRVDTAAGEPMAVLFNLALHPIATDAKLYLFTADLSGYAERYVQDTLGPNVVAMHINGAQGDISCAPRGIANAHAAGAVWGQAILDQRAAIADVNTSVGLAMRTITHRFPPPYLRPALFEPTLPLPLWITISLTAVMPDSSRFTAFRINDDCMIATIPGEAITQIGLDIRRGCEALGFPTAMVFGLSQNHLSYFVTEREYWQGGYEAGACVFGPEAGMLIAGYALDAVDDVAN